MYQELWFVAINDGSRLSFVHIQLAAEYVRSLRLELVDESSFMRKKKRKVLVVVVREWMKEGYLYDHSLFSFNPPIRSMSILWNRPPISFS